MKSSFTIDSLLDKPDQLEDAPTRLSKPLPLCISPMYPNENTNGIPSFSIPPFDMISSMIDMNPLPQTNPFLQQSVNLPFFTILQNLSLMMTPQTPFAQVSVNFSDAISKLHTQILTNNRSNDVVIQSQHQDFSSKSPAPKHDQQQVARGLNKGALKWEKGVANPSLTTRQIWELLEKDGVHSVKNQQTEILLEAFQSNQTPSASEIDRLAQKTGRSKLAIKAWFERKRKDLEKQNSEADAEHEEMVTEA